MSQAFQGLMGSPNPNTLAAPHTSPGHPALPPFSGPL